MSFTAPITTVKAEDYGEEENSPNVDLVGAGGVDSYSRGGKFLGDGGLRE